jgi:hypothetical protein
VRRLSREAFARARNFVTSEARPLERALFEHRFEGAPARRVTAALADYQNDDGGFGHALEPDARTPTSSALATGIGLRILREVGCPAGHPLVGPAVGWLQEAYEPTTHTWRALPRDANDHPHAPWWHDEDGSLARTFDQFLVIPRAEIVGLLHQYASLVPAEWLDDLTARTAADLETIEPFASGGGDDLVYALSLADTEALPARYRSPLLRRIRAVVPSAVSQDPGEWDSYCILPLKVAPAPSSPVADLIADALAAHLEYQIEHQGPKGTWDPVWTWGEAYPAAWQQARQEWRGHLTLEALTSLRAYGRLGT